MITVNYVGLSAFCFVIRVSFKSFVIEFETLVWCNFVLSRLYNSVFNIWSLEYCTPVVWPLLFHIGPLHVFIPQTMSRLMMSTITFAQIKLFGCNKSDFIFTNSYAIAATLNSDLWLSCQICFCLFLFQKGSLCFIYWYTVIRDLFYDTEWAFFDC